MNAKILQISNPLQILNNKISCYIKQRNSRYMQLIYCQTICQYSFYIFINALKSKNFKYVIGINYSMFPQMGELGTSLRVYWQFGEQWMKGAKGLSPLVCIYFQRRPNICKSNTQTVEVITIIDYTQYKHFFVIRSLVILLTELFSIACGL